MTFKLSCCAAASAVFFSTGFWSVSQVSVEMLFIRFVITCLDLISWKVLGGR